MSPNECSQTNVNKPHPNNPELQINCRNIWFNEFWSQHHKCSFDESALVPCTGNETFTNYEQEGLVPFVGEYHASWPKLEFGFIVMFNCSYAVDLQKTLQIRLHFQEVGANG